ncbi:MAG: hypothetical protein ACYTDY_07615 [Planctomycetota bacterium]|jgi:hypothetical protein
MGILDPGEHRERERARQRFHRWRPPDDPWERATRLAWLEDANRLARERGLIEDRPEDAAEQLEHRRRIREALAVIRG